MKNTALAVFLLPFITIAQWTQLGTDIDGKMPDDSSATSISLNTERNTLAIGSPFNDDNGENTGHSRIIEFINFI